MIFSAYKHMLSYVQKLTVIMFIELQSENFREL